MDIKKLEVLANNERHFHTIQAGIRGLTSSWTLASIGAISYLINIEKNSLWLDPFILLIFLILIVNVGITVLWIIDQKIYQRLFNTNYLVGLKLEENFPEIPPTRAVQALSTKGRSIASWIKFFYLGPIIAFSIFSLAINLQLLVTPSELKSLSPFYFLGVSSLSILSVVPAIWLILQARGVSFFQMASSIHEGYSELLTMENCSKILERHNDWLSSTRTHKS